MVACVAGLYGFPYPYERLWEAWDVTLFNQFHDILDGSGIPETYEYSNAIAEEAEGKAEAVLVPGSKRSPVMGSETIRSHRARLAKGYPYWSSTPSPGNAAMWSMSSRKRSGNNR